MDFSEFEHKKFRTRLMGVDPGEVESFVQELAEEIGRLKSENEALKRDLQSQEMELRGHRDRESAIRNVLLTAQKAAEQVKANAEKEARLIISEAEVRVEKMIQDAGERVSRMDREISELKRHRIQFGARVRTLLDTFRQILDESGEEKLASSIEERGPFVNDPSAQEQPVTIKSAKTE